MIGTRPIRHDGTDKVTGRALYGADIRLPGMLYGAVLRSPHAHARILAIDTSRAAALPGVKAVITAADLPALEDKIEDLGEGVVNLRYQSANVLARDKVLYYGHAVAAVAATSLHIAEEALALIQVTYELLPPVLDVRQAMPRMRRSCWTTCAPTSWAAKAIEAPTSPSHLQHQRGDLAAASPRRR